MEDNINLLQKQTTKDFKDKLYFTCKQQGYSGIQQSNINGTFHIRYPKNSPLRVEKIDIVFSGKSTVQWNEGSMINYARKKYFEYTCCVYNSLSDEGISYLDLPFEFKIPENVLPSVSPIPSKLTNHLGKAEIYYSIKAVITKRKKEDRRFMLMGSKKIVETKCPITRYAQQKEIERQESITLTKKFNNNEYTVMFDKTIFSQNDVINVPLNIIFNNQRENLKDIKKVQISLKEFYQLKAGKKSHLIKNNLFTGIINKEKFSRVDDSFLNEYFVNCKLFLYGKRVRCDVKSDLVNIWHQVDIVVYLKGMKRVRIEKVVSIINAIDEFKNVNEEEGEECETW